MGETPQARRKCPKSFFPSRVRGWRGPQRTVPDRDGVHQEQFLGWYAYGNPSGHSPIGFVGTPEWRPRVQPPSLGEYGIPCAQCFDSRTGLKVSVMGRTEALPMAEDFGADRIWRGNLQAQPATRKPSIWPWSCSQRLATRRLAPGQ